MSNAIAREVRAAVQCPDMAIVSLVHIGTETMQTLIVGRDINAFT